MTAFAQILVVDDDAIVRSFLMKLLTGDGYQVTAVNNGEAALETIATHSFDLALIDLQMPGIGGMEVLAALGQQSPDTASIILTGHGSIESAAEAVRQAAHDYLFKPCKADTLRKSVRAGLEKRRRLLQARAQARLVADVSHELRSPLTAINLNLCLTKRAVPEKRAFHLDLVQQGTKQMEHLVESILTLSQLEADETRAKFAPEDLNTLVDQVVGAQQVRAEAAGLELIFEPGTNLPPVRADCNQLIQVVINLVSNAINYTPAGQVQVSTCLDTYRGQACLQVQDTGIGIEAEDVPRLFERFYRGSRATETDIPGTGLGLAIVKEIIEQHGGKIEVESQVNEGSTFIVWLPLENHNGKSVPGRGKVERRRVVEVQAQ